MSNPVGWFEIYVDDLARARKFYETVFQFVLLPLEGGGPDMMAFPSTMETYGAGGALVHKSKWSIGQYGNIALVADTEGNMLGLHSM